MPTASQTEEQTPRWGRKWNGSKWIRPEKRKAIYCRDGGMCCYCDATTDLTLDHIIPNARGGHNYENNLITACARCNKRRQDMEFEDFMLRIAPRDGKRRIKRVLGLIVLPLEQFRRIADMVSANRSGTKPN